MLLTNGQKIRSICSHNVAKSYFVKGRCKHVECSAKAIYNLSPKEKRRFNSFLRQIQATGRNPDPGEIFRKE
jgi:hypothetical protein